MLFFPKQNTQTQFSVLMVGTKRHNHCLENLLGVKYSILTVLVEINDNMQHRGIVPSNHPIFELFVDCTWCGIFIFKFLP